MKTLTFHADHTVLILYSGGLPVTVSGEVDITVTKPTKLSAKNREAWDHAARSPIGGVSTVEVVPTKEG